MYINPRHHFALSLQHVQLAELNVHIFTFVQDKILKLTDLRT